MELYNYVKVYDGNTWEFPVLFDYMQSYERNIGACERFSWTQLYVGIWA